MKAIVYKCIVVMVLALVFCSCNDAVDIKQDYDFSLSSWYLQSEAAVGETVEIRFYLERAGDYEKAAYEIGYVQLAGKGEVTDLKGQKLINREVLSLENVPGLNRENPTKQVFTLFYRSTSTKRSEVKFFVRDNFGQEREMTVKFDAASSSEE